MDQKGIWSKSSEIRGPAGEASAFCSRFSPGTAVPTHSTWDCICKAFHSKSLTTTGLKNARPRHLSALCGPPGFRGSCCLHTGGGNGSVLRTDNQQHHGPPGNLFGRQIPQPRRTEPETLGVGPSGCSSSVLHVIRTEAIEFENRFRGMDATPSPDL